MSTPSNHEPECDELVERTDTWSCFCALVRAIYQRGREDAHDIAFEMLHRPTTGEEPRTIILEDLFIALKGKP